MKPVPAKLRRMPAGKVVRQYYPGLAEKVRRAYRKHIDAIRDTAAKLGYAIGEHGSLARDIDLIAVPWTEQAAPATELVEAIVKAIKGYRPVQKPSRKPHGRRAWSIHLGGGPYVDLSVVPRRGKKAAR